MKNSSDAVESLQTDRGFLYGDGLFETVLVVDSRVRWLDHHVARLRHSGAALGFPEDIVDEAVTALVGVEDSEDGLWRVTLTRPGRGVDYGGTGTVKVQHRPWAPRDRPRLTAALGYYFPGDIVAEYKTTSRMRYVQARRRAREAGFDDALLLSLDAGRGAVIVGETTAASVFVVQDDEVVTPMASGIVRGVTRKGILEGGQWGGLPVSERWVEAGELDTAREIVLVNAGGVVAAASYGDRPLDDRWASRLASELP